MPVRESPRVVSSPTPNGTVLEIGQRKSSPVVVWAVLGFLFLVLELYVVGGWLLSGPTANHTGASDAPERLRVAAIFLQGASLILWPMAAYHWLVKPWRRERRITLDGLFTIVFTLIAWQDPISNYSGSWFAYNTLYVNLGSWVERFPGWMNPLHQDQLPWPFLQTWQLYLYGLFGGVIFGGFVMRKAKERWPQLSTFALVAICYVTLAFIDLVGEPFYMWAFGAWTYPGSHPGLTIFAGHYYQFPLYESVMWSVLWTAWACMRHFRNDKGETFAERGIEDVRVGPRAKVGIRLLALSGAVNLMFLGMYNMPMILFWGQRAGPWPKDVVNRPYFNAGACGPGTDFACPGPEIPNPKRLRELGPGGGVSIHVGPDGTLIVPDGLRAPRSR